MYIDHLHKRLQVMKDDRKKAEMENEILKNRLVLLQTQEQAAVQKFERTKWQINQIVQNRKYFNYEDKRRKNWKETKEKEADELKQRVQKIRLSRSNINYKNASAKKQNDDLKKSQTKIHPIVFIILI